ncbi:NifB/NifX family molybdenum-iron cluster-binding protein [Candidatus Sumerlaeota bacterium]
MKIAITSAGTDLASPLDPRFGRAQAFIVYDTESDKFEAVDNSQNLNAVQGAGIQAAENVVRLGVACVITGNCGPKAFRALQSAGIKIMLCVGGTVQEAIDQFKAGDLEETDNANVGGHWG